MGLWLEFYISVQVRVIMLIMAILNQGTLEIPILLLMEGCLQTHCTLYVFHYDLGFLYLQDVLEDKTLFNSYLFNFKYILNQILSNVICFSHPLVQKAILSMDLDPVLGVLTTCSELKDPDRLNDTLPQGPAGVARFRFLFEVVLLSICC